MVIPVGTIMGERYRVVSYLAGGGMGAVYEAFDERLQRRVAMKVLLSQLSEDGEALSRFEREAVAVARLQHPAIPQVFDAGATAAGEPYLVMEYVDGVTLAKLLGTRGAFAPAAAVRLLRQLASALAFAHDAGIVHRDLKPGNVMVSAGRDGETLRLLDFGIASLKASAVYDRLTRTGVLVGTPTFMAPEQALGGPVDARTDVHGVGVLAFCMLAGARPFGSGDIANVLTNVVSLVPPRVDQLVTGVPRELGDLCERALRKDAGERYQSMHELLDALDKVELTGMARAPSPTHTAVPIAPVSFAAVSLAPMSIAPVSIAPVSLGPMSIAPVSPPPLQTHPTPTHAATTLGASPAAQLSWPGVTAAASPIDTKPRMSTGLVVLIASAVAVTLTLMVGGAMLIGGYAYLTRDSRSAGPGLVTTPMLGSPSFGAPIDTTGFSHACVTAAACCAEYERVVSGEVHCERILGATASLGDAHCREVASSFTTTIGMLHGDLTLCAE